MKSQMNKVEQLDEGMVDEIMKDQMYKKAYFEAGLAWAKSLNYMKSMIGLDYCYNPYHQAYLFSENHFDILGLLNTRFACINTECELIAALIKSLRAYQHLNDDDKTKMAGSILFYACSIPVIAYLSQIKHECQSGKKIFLLDLNEPYLASLRYFYDRFVSQEEFKIFQDYVAMIVKRTVDIVELNWSSIEGIATLLLNQGTANMEEINNVVEQDVCSNSRTTGSSISIIQYSLYQDLLIIQERL